MQHIVRNYAELDKWSSAFAKGSFGLFFLIGHQGQAKSTFIRRLVMDAPKPKPKPAKGKGKAGLKLYATPPHDMHIAEPLWFEGGAVSAFRLYQELFIHQHETVVLDDVDSIYNDRQLVRLLKALCQTKAVEKEIGWHTNSPQLEKAGIPNRFRTRSRVCIIANRWKTLSEHVGSLVDRGQMIHFQPSPREVFNYAKKHVCKDKEILKFVDGFLWMVGELSLRLFINAEEAKRAKLPWKESVVDSLGIRDMVLVRELQADVKNFHSTEERVAEFQRRTRQSRPMFFKAVKELGELLKAHPDKHKHNQRKVK